MERLQKAREKIEEFSKEHSRTKGEMGAIQNQVKEQEQKCKDDFHCEISELPALISQLRQEAEKALTNAEIILGLREGVINENKEIIPSPSVNVEKNKTDEDSLFE